MKKLSFLTAIFILTVLHFYPVSINAASEHEYSTTTIIVKLKTSTQLLKDVRNAVPRNYEDKFTAGSIILGGFSRVVAFMNDHSLSSIKAVKPDAGVNVLPGGIERIFISELTAGMDPVAVIEQLKQHSSVEYAEVDYIGYGGGAPADIMFSPSSIVPNDAQFGNQYGLRNTGQTINGVAGTVGGDINAVNAWDITQGNPTLIISVLDSGIPLGHPEFAGRLVQGYDFANNDNTPTDDQGHGTNVSSITSAKGNNGSLVAGVNWNSRLLPVKILDNNNTGQYSWFISGITYAVDHGAKILNMSVGGSGFSQGMADAITYANANNRIVVACMMNNNNSTTYYPAGLSNVIAIGAINNRMRRAVPFCWGGGSSYGPHIDFCAPGEMIVGLVHNNMGTVNYWCGTSQATPMTAGVISLMCSIDSSLTFNQIYNLLKNSARDQVGLPAEDTPGFDNYHGWGLIDARGALDKMIGIQQISTEVTERFSLEQNFPNPFNPITNIRFELPAKSHVKLTVLNSLGQEVAALVNSDLAAGKYNYDWDASKYSSGIYFYKIETENFSEVRKMILVK